MSRDEPEATQGAERSSSPPATARGASHPEGSHATWSVPSKPRELRAWQPDPPKLEIYVPPDGWFDTVIEGLLDFCFFAASAIVVVGAAVVALWPVLAVAGPWEGPVVASRALTLSGGFVLAVGLSVIWRARPSAPPGRTHGPRPTLGLGLAWVVTGLASVVVSLVMA